MAPVVLIYFGSCPNIEIARNALNGAGISHFEEFDQLQLLPDHEYLFYSSPSILVGTKLIFGSKLTTPGSAACSLGELTSNELRRRIGIY
ncbi:MAG: hypothetical protein AB7T49_19995 [Oligoflexales bacterium]